VSTPAVCSPQACRGVGILLQRLYAGQELSRLVLSFVPLVGVWVPFSVGARERTLRV
jgi:hypothetical protein